MTRGAGVYVGNPKSDVVSAQGAQAGGVKPRDLGSIDVPLDQVGIFGDRDLMPGKTEVPIRARPYLGVRRICILVGGNGLLYAGAVCGASDEMP